MKWLAVNALISVGWVVVILWSLGQIASPPNNPPPSPPAFAFRSSYDDALFQVSYVFGKGGCGDAELAEAVARWAKKNRIPASLLAAKVVVESKCNPLAVSHKGAVGLTQVVPAVWKESYDFSKMNLLNREDALRVGSEILATLIAKHGIRDGIRRYNGSGDGARLYADEVLALARIP